MLHHHFVQAGSMESKVVRRRLKPLETGDKIWFL